MGRLVNSLVALYNNVKSCCVVVFKALPTMTILVMPYMCLVIGAVEYNKRGELKVGLEWLLPVVCYVVAWLLHYMNVAGSDELRGFPVARRRFTKRDRLGKVIFRNTDIYEMVEYLCELEEYCERYGKYKNGGRKR